MVVRSVQLQRRIATLGRSRATSRAPLFLPSLMPALGARIRSLLSSTALARTSAAAALLSGVWLGATAARADDTTWTGLASLGNNFYPVDANWTNRAPGYGDTAFFGSAKVTTLQFGLLSANFVDGWTFNAGASNYTFDLPWITGASVIFTGAGIIINGGSATFTNDYYIEFDNSSTAGSASFINTAAAHGLGVHFRDTSTAGNANFDNSGYVSFADSSTAGNASITNSGTVNFANNSTAGGANIINTRTVNFTNSSTAGNASITNTDTGTVNFTNSSTAGNARITNTWPGAVNFADSSTAGNASITNAGILNFTNSSTAGNANITSSGLFTFSDTSTAGSATILSGITFKNSSTAGSATIINTGYSWIRDGASGGAARFILTSIGFLDLSYLTTGGTTAGSIEGTGSVFLGSKKFVVGSNNLSTTFSGVIQDGGDGGGTGGSLTKTGAGALTLSGVSAYTGTTTVDAGTLTVDGSIATSTLLTVNAGATLGGNGILGTVLVNGGTLAPGHSIGTLTIGNLTMTAASAYLVQVSGGSADKTIVTGLATLGGKVVVDPLAWVTTTTSYTIMTAGTVSGTYSGVEIANNFARNARLSYVGNDVLLMLDPSLLSPSLPGNANLNQMRIATAIDNALVGGASLPAAFNALFALSGNPLLNALSQASGESATGSQQTTFNAMTQFMGFLTDPHAGRGNAINGATSTPGYVEESSAYAASRTPKDAFAMFTKARPIPFAPRWSVWAAGYGGSQTADGNALTGSNDTRSSIFGTAVGANYQISPNTLAGFALAGGGTNFSVNNLGGGRSDLFQAGAYMRHTNEAAYVTGALAYGWQDITTNRTVTIAGLDQLRAEFKANAFSGRLESGYRFVAPWIGGVGITPYVAGQFTTFDLPAYAESAVTGTPNFALAYGAKSVTDPRSELGLRTDKSFAMTDGILTLRGRLAWAHDFNSDRSIGATFQSLPAASFVVGGAAQASDSALTTASAEMKWSSGWSAAASFEGEFSNLTRSYAGKAAIRYAW
ncbi:hypothetical protein XH89_00570 [Bradyrhizobium sp. CCBAU 53340]|nr:hypothetical protein XH89_00570 [Bradyrhizobium sp. CCBAU 53340]